MKTLPRPNRSVYFNHSLYKRAEITRDDSGKLRTYSIGDGVAYPSITTILGNVLNKEGLDRWKQSIGVDKANRLAHQAAVRGTKLHTMCENYMLNHNYFDVGQMPDTMYLFNQIRPYLDSKIQEVYGVELPLLSRKLKAAGTCDLVCKIDEELCVLDFKTSTNLKQEDYIESYYLQATAYCHMVNELYDSMPTKFVILIATEQNTFQVFEGSPFKYTNRLEEVIDSYYQKNSG
jgi:hypothetical protein